MFYQYTVHDKCHDQSSSFSQFINGKSRSLQTLLTCLSRIVAFTFKAGIVGYVGCRGCCGSDPSGFGGSCGTHSGLSGFS